MIRSYFCLGGPLKNRLIKLLLLVGITGSSSWSTELKDLCSGALPFNNLSIPVQSNNPTGLTKEEYDLILDRTEQIFADDFKQKGTRLQIERLWTSPTVNASASIAKDGTRLLIMHGGYARHKLTSPDVFASTVCHELGHHLGGAPMKFSWLSIEGQADYFSTLKCLKRFFADDDNARLIEGKVVPPIVKSDCKKQHPNLHDELICIRSALASYGAVLVSNSVNPGQRIPRFDTPSKEVATGMEGSTRFPLPSGRRIPNLHPKLQCRLDTYFSGALCNVSVSTALSNENYVDGTCESDEYPINTKRPRCWFLP